MATRLSAQVPTAPQVAVTYTRATKQSAPNEKNVLARTKRCLELCRILNCDRKASIGAGLSVGVCSVGWCEGGGVTRNGNRDRILHALFAGVIES